MLPRRDHRPVNRTSSETLLRLRPTRAARGARAVGDSEPARGFGGRCFGARSDAGVSRRPASVALPPERGLAPEELLELHARYRSLVSVWARRFFRDGASSEDAVQELWIRLMERGAVWRLLGSEEQRRGWLRTVAFRLCLDLIAKRSRDRLRDAAAAESTRGYCEPAFEERSTLASLLRGLDPEERKLAVLFFEEGFTKSEIHESVQRSRPFIDKKLNRICDTLTLVERGRAPAERRLSAG